MGYGNRLGDKVCDGESACPVATAATTTPYIKTRIFLESLAVRAVQYDSLTVQ